ncbi:cytochrome c [Verticiella sediminum]|uniref:Cytochrome c n=1 Tax=Verticiella sediminum TaxID=1247510 RepID=A0A556A982_9BURK|nr:cytochrome c [Verticiella sediminum]TSH89435.1 cytochrome c [Verticiella sediminum]
MIRSARVLTACTLALAAAAPIAFAEPQFDNTQEAVAYRQAALRLMGAHFNGLAPVMRGRATFDAAAVQQEVAVLRTLATLPWRGFADGAEGGNAQPAVWKDSARFEAALKNFQQSMGRLSQVAGEGDFDTIRAAYGDVAASCKACHQDFRQRR